MEEADWETEFDAVRQYLLQSPLSSEHPAVVAALQGLDQEVKRRRRDAKLQQKFSAASSTTTSHPEVMGDVEMDAVKVEVPSKEAKSLERKHTREDDSNMSMADDWQDIVGEDDMPRDDTNADGAAGVLGTEMAKQVVALLAAHQVTCASPRAALAVALHAVLLQCDFLCTGVPERAPPAGGFAAPIRDVPMGQLLPANWEVPVQGIQLRYRHRNVAGAYVLSVTTSSEGEGNGATVQVSWTGNSSSLEPFQFPLSDHMNLHSWTMAQQKSDGKISPVLHYKALAPLLTKFMQHFSLKTKEEEKDQDVTVPIIDESYLQARYLQELEARPICPGIPNPRDVSDRMYPAVVNSMRSSWAAPRPGAFDGDLHPLGGLYPPSDGTLFPGGNLMGPNHPLFTGGGAHLPGGGMHPRFDPFGPPGGPTEPVPPPLQVDPPGNSFPAGGTGNPNNDLAIPPPFGGNNMFL